MSFDQEHADEFLSKAESISKQVHDILEGKDIDVDATLDKMKQEENTKKVLEEMKVREH